MRRGNSVGVFVARVLLVACRAVVTTMAVGSGGGLIGFVAGTLVVGGLAMMTATPPPSAPTPSISNREIYLAMTGGALGWLVGGVVGSGLGPVVQASRDPEVPSSVDATQPMASATR